MPKLSFEHQRASLIRKLRDSKSSIKSPNLKNEHAAKSMPTIKEETDKEIDEFNNDASKNAPNKKLEKVNDKSLNESIKE